jgi:hypothetical protein
MGSPKVTMQHLGEPGALRGGSCASNDSERQPVPSLLIKYVSEGARASFVLDRPPAKYSDSRKPIRPLAFLW